MKLQPSGPLVGASLCIESSCDSVHDLIEVLPAVISLVACACCAAQEAGGQQKCAVLALKIMRLQQHDASTFGET